MNTYQFSWCVCSFDQECNIEASSKEKAINIFKENVKNVWELNKPYVFNLNSKYKNKWIKENIKINFKENDNN